MKQNKIERISFTKALARSSQSGFTLAEILVVIALIAVVGTLAFTQIGGRFSQAKVDATKITMRQMKTILDDYRRVCNFYPTTAQGLDALIKAPEGERTCKNYPVEGFIDKKQPPQDAWDADFIYESDGRKVMLKSLGADGQEGGEEYDKDITLDDLDE